MLRAGAAESCPSCRPSDVLRLFHVVVASLHSPESSRIWCAPVEFAAPTDTAFEIGAVSIVKGGPNLAGGKAFVDWVLTKEASELNVKLSNRLSVLKDVPPAPGAPTLDKVKLVAYDRAWATDNKDRLLKSWSSAVGR